MADKQSYYEVLTAAIADLAENGFDSAERVTMWSRRIRDAAEAMLKPPGVMEQMLRDALAAIYKKMVDQGQLARFHQGVERWTIERVRPQLRAELDRRIMASANLIRLNRQQMIDKTLQRFSGWATSIPAGGSDATSRRETKEAIRKPLASAPFEERRVLIDQGHKLRASLSEILASDGGAIALIWRSHWRQPGYDYREDHKERDGLCYAIRGNWALAKGLMKAGPAGYYDDITAVAQEPFCRCYATWLYALRDLPDEMLTVKGRDALAEARQKIKEMA